MSAVPSELLVAPQPLIGLCGLDVSRNAVHKAVWEAFSGNRKIDRANVQFKLLPPNYEFPVAKPKRASYEWYHPKGILKRNWMLKHLHVLPSVVVLFQDMEWNDAQWSEKQLQCAATVQGLKNSLQERNTRLCLVLLQKAAPLPPGEDLLASERAASLTAACGVNSKMLFILPHTEHLMGYTLRLESAFLDMSQSYYALMSKRIRTHRDQLTVAHTTLKIRHQFKLGFVAEMRQDFSTALKHYTQAYAILDEIRIIDTNCLEIKTIGGFLNYKICRLMFKLKVPRDAINHFISHIEKYKNRVGFKDLIFEHYAWLSTQHSIFAELFCEAIKNGLPALQTQHPGIYFHKAAEYIIKRKEAFLQPTGVLLSPTEPNMPTPLQNNNSLALYTEFFGIRAVKTGEPIAEQQSNMLLRENEKSFNHSAAIINLLGQAMAQFKIYKCLRFRKKLAIDMAEEYFKSGDHAKALTLYSLMLPDYRQDKWTSIFSDVLLKTLRSALLSASVADYIGCSIEALALKVCSDQKDRIMVLENLWKVFQGVPPVSQTQNSPEIRNLWENTLANVKSPILIDLDKLSDVFEMCTSFENVELKNVEIIKVHLILKLLTDVPMKLRSISILLTDGTNTFKLHALKYTTFANLLEIRESYQSKAASSSSISQSPTYHTFENDLKFEPEIYYQLLFTTEAQQFLENTQLRVTRIEAQMGTDKLSALLVRNASFARKAFRHHSRQRDLDDNIVINSMCYIAPTFHLNTQTNLGNEMMLVNEYYPVVTTVNNAFNVFLQNVGLNITIPNHLRNKVFLATDIAPSRQKLHSHIQIDIGDLAMQSSNTVSYYVFSLVETTITLQQKIWYTMDVLLPKVPAASAFNDSASSSNNNSVDNSPDAVRMITSDVTATGNAMPLVSPVQIEFIDEGRLRKTREDTLSIKCDLEFKFSGRFYTLDKKPLKKIYRGENFLFRVNVEVQSEWLVDILETYFICDHNLVQSTYSFQRKKFTSTYHSGDKLEDVIVLRTNATWHDWISAKEFDRSKSDPRLHDFHRTRSTHSTHSSRNHVANNGTTAHSYATAAGAAFSASSSASASHMNKSLMGKIPTNMTIISNATASSNNNSNVNNINSLMATSQNSNMSTSSLSDDGKAMTTSSLAAANVDASELSVAVDNAPSQGQSHKSQPQPQTQLSSRLIFNKAMEAVQATGHCRGFVRGVVTTEQQQPCLPLTPQQQPFFGVYCIKWRRHGDGVKEENESKFVITGLDIEEPPLNIYCSIEERMFVKMPITFKVVLKNPTPTVIHLIATLSVSTSDNFICSGHKQLDISIFAHGEKELVYNLYPLCVGWQNLPELTLEYNTQANPTKRDETKNNLLCELVQRSVPKKVFVLPPLKQQLK